VKVFISYSRKQGNRAAEIFHALDDAGHEVFWDKKRLPPGRGYGGKIRAAIDDSDLVILLLSRAAIEKGSYCLAELTFAKHRWPGADEHLLVVEIEKIEHMPAHLGRLAPYICAVTPLVPVGNVGFEVAAEVGRLAGLKAKERKRGIVVERKYEGVRIVARANRPITTKIELWLDGSLVASDSRPWSASVAYGVAAVFGLKPKWSVEADAAIKAATVRVRAEFVTEFVTQYFRLYVGGNLIESR
jgi:hypothetical protein